MKANVSIIIPTHNRAESLGKALRSILKQTYQDFEIIIVNDASSDNTIQIVNKLQSQDNRIHLINNAVALGGAGARNCGIEQSTGNWIAFLDDDDEWLPQKLAKQLQALAHHPKAIATSCSYVVNYPMAMKRVVNPPKDISYENLLAANTLGGASVCIANAEVIKKIGGFDKKLRSSQDWDLWLRLREVGNIISIDDVLVSYHVHFALRISNNMQAKYIGARRFYYKHKSRMTENSRLANLSFICFIQSRQKHRSIKSRIQKLLMAVKYSSRRTGISYLLSSLPRIMAFS